MAWISVKDRLPEMKQNVDLWIRGEAMTIDFYDSSRKKVRAVNGVKEGRTTNWFLADGDWHAAGLGLRLSVAVQATHWMPLPDPPDDGKAAAK